jgi:hypothetical protein
MNVHEIKFSYQGTNYKILTEYNLEAEFYNRAKKIVAIYVNGQSKLLPDNMNGYLYYDMMIDRWKIRWRSNDRQNK